MPKISIPSVSSNLPPDMRAFVQRVREAFSLFADGVITRDDLERARIIAISPGGQVIPGDAVGDTNYTPPPAPTGFTATGALTTIILDWDEPTYSNHSYTEIWRSTTDNLGTAVKVGTTDSSMYSDSLGTTGFTYYYWIRFVSSSNPPMVGPYNATAGTQAATTLVGNSNLGPLVVQAGNLAAGAVTSDKTLLELGGDNLLGNNSFEIDTNADGLADGWIQYNNSSGTEPSTASRVAGRMNGYAQRIAWTGTNTSTKGVVFDSLLRGGVWLPNKTYVVSWYARADSNKAVGMGMYWNTQPASQVAIKNPNLTTNYQRYAFRLTWGAAVEALGRAHVSVQGGAAVTGWLEFDDFQVEEGDTLTGYFGKLATNTIVAGDGAIANLAITNALIANLAVDTAKMADLSVVTAKIGALAVTNEKIGGYIQSTGYVPGSTGWIINKDGTVEFNNATIRGGVWAGSVSSTAGVTMGAGGHIKGGATAYATGTGIWMGYDGGAYKFSLGAAGGARLTWDGSTFTIYDSLNQVVLASGSGVPWTKISSPPTSLSGINSSEGTKLAGIQAGADVTATHTAAAISGQGAFATLNQITGSNVATYIAQAAIGNAQIGGDIYSDLWISSGNTQGWYLQRHGNLYCANAYVRGDVQATSLNAATGTFSGTMTASAVNAVNTINLAGDAVTVPVGASGTNGASVTITIPSDSPNSKVIIWGSSTSDVSAYYASNLSIKRGATTLATAYMPPPPQNERYTVVCIAIDQPGVGTYTYSVNDTYAYNIKIIAQLGKR